MNGTGFTYTDEQWRAIADLLGSLGVDADRAAVWELDPYVRAVNDGEVYPGTKFYVGGPYAPMPLRYMLEHAAGSYLTAMEERSKWRTPKQNIRNLRATLDAIATVQTRAGKLCPGSVEREELRALQSFKARMRQRLANLENPPSQSRSNAAKPERGAFWNDLLQDLDTFTGSAKRLPRKSKGEFILACSTPVFFEESSEKKTPARARAKKIEKIETAITNHLKRADLVKTNT